jgi:Tol biopolymer transport system component
MMGRKTADMERKLFAFSCIAFLILIDVSVHARELEDKIVFVSERRGTPEVFLVEGLDGRPFQLTRNLFASWPSISPEGTEIAFVAEPPGQRVNIFKLNIATRRIEQLTNNAERNIRYEHLDWSPDGQKILFTMITDAVEGAKTDLCVMDIEERHIRHILQPDSPMWIVHPNWSPDSEHIIYYYQDTGEGRAGIAIISNDGNDIVNITSHPFTPVFLPTWSPKRSQIGYIANTIITQPPPPNPLQIYMMNLAKESVTALTSGGAEERIPLDWHPDGQKILFAMLNPVGRPGPDWSDIFVMDNNGENIINLTQTPEEEAHASWSPDGEQIVFDRLLKKGEAIGDFESAIFVMEADGQNPQRLTFEPGLNFAPVWSPDGNRIAFLSYRNGALRIHTMDINGQNVQQITHHGRELDGPPVWSPDGRWIAFMSRDDQDWGLYITDPQGHHENLITRFKLTNLSGPAWSPDSQHLIYAVEEQNSAGLMKIRIDEKVPTQLKTDELMNWSTPVWSPEGDNLLFSAREAREPIEPIYIGTEYTMYLMNLDTAQKHAFVLLRAFEKKYWSLSRLVWEPDGSQLILSGRERDLPRGEGDPRRERSPNFALSDRSCQRNHDAMDGRCETGGLGQARFRVCCGGCWKTDHNVG